MTQALELKFFNVSDARKAVKAFRDLKATEITVRAGGLWKDLDDGATITADGLPIERFGLGECAVLAPAGIEETWAATPIDAGVCVPAGHVLIKAVFEV